MSRKSNQSIGLLCVWCDVIHTMRTCRVFAKVDLQRTMDAMYDDALHAIKHWPILTDRKWVTEKRDEFKKYIEDLDKEHYSTAELVRMLERIAVDLIDFNKVGSRRGLVEKLHPGAQQLISHVDPDGRHFESFDSSSVIMDRLYEIFSIMDEAYR